ncbi:hypothetical protein HKX48_006067 [Thoreauomyces humboldtii]|nr:hypothetical protein HKX48_006067 [Thoreauomyces humboldtii]
MASHHEPSLSWNGYTSLAPPSTRASSMSTSHPSLRQTVVPALRNVIAQRTLLDRSASSLESSVSHHPYHHSHLHQQHHVDQVLPGFPVPSLAPYPIPLANIYTGSHDNIVPVNQMQPSLIANPNPAGLVASDRGWSIPDMNVAAADPVDANAGFWDPERTPELMTESQESMTSPMATPIFSSSSVLPIPISIPIPTIDSKNYTDNADSRDHQNDRDDDDIGARDETPPGYAIKGGRKLSSASQVSSQHQQDQQNNKFSLAFFSMTDSDQKETEAILSRSQLIVRQQPVRARMIGFGEKDRRPIDPPPILQIRLRSEDGQALIRMREPRTKRGRQPLFQPLLALARIILILHIVKPPSWITHRTQFALRRPHAGPHSVRVSGRYRLKFLVFDVNSSLASPDAVVTTPHCAISDVFTVYHPKEFPGMGDSTTLSKCLSRQGLRIHIRVDAHTKLKVLPVRYGDVGLAAEP